MTLTDQKIMEAAEQLWNGEADPNHFRLTALQQARCRDDFVGFVARSVLQHTGKDKVAYLDRARLRNGEGIIGKEPA